MTHHQPPWRPMDMPDDILKRSTRTDPAIAFLTDVDPESIVEDYDCAYVVEWQGARGVQPVLWRMRTHVHSDECGRA